MKELLNYYVLLWRRESALGPCSHLYHAEMKPISNIQRMVKCIDIVTVLYYLLTLSLCSISCVSENWGNPCCKSWTQSVKTMAFSNLCIVLYLSYHTGFEARYITTSPFIKDSTGISLSITLSEHKTFQQYYKAGTNNWLETQTAGSAAVMNLIKVFWKPPQKPPMQAYIDFEYWNLQAYAAVWFGMYSSWFS